MLGAWGEPTFVVGVGSQRAGSTLLAAGLQYASDVLVHPLKELHYFDSIHGVRDFGFLASQVTQLRASATTDATGGRSVMRRLMAPPARRRSGPRGRRPELSRGRKRRTERLRQRARRATLDSLADCADVQDLAGVPYRSLFAPMLRAGLPVAEFTPEYMALPESGIRHLHAETGPQTRIIIQTRDPAKRLLSAYVLRETGWGRARTAAEVSEKWLFDELRHGSDWLKLQARLCDYAGAETRFRAQFERVHVVSMERLVAGSADELTALAGFLPGEFDRDRFRALLHTKVNSFGERQFSTRLVAAVQEWLTATAAAPTTRGALRTAQARAA
jgi:hypothetical protein